MTERTPGGRRYLATVVGIPILVVRLGLALVAVAWAQLPPVVASHWGPNGVDGTQSRLAFTVTATVVILGLAALLAAVAWILPGDGRRLMATLVGVLSGFLGVLLFGALLGQRGVTDAADAALPSGLFLAGALVAAGLGALAWWANPVRPRRATTVPPVPADAPRLPLTEGERLAWFGWTASAPWVVWTVLGLAALGCLVAAVAAPWAAAGPALAVVLLLLMAHARVVVDADGLRVTSAGFLRWLHVPLEEIAYAGRGEIQGLKQFGGFGLRYARDARAFVTRSGAALEVVQRDGTRTYVSMDDADEAAAVLNGLVARDVRS